MSLSPGTKLGSYEIVAPLGAGGMGEVYRAWDGKLRREVAVKVLPQALSKDATALARFEREALAVAALSHPNILSIFDFGSQEGVTYAVTELLEGGTLRSRLLEGPVPLRQAVDLALQIARGLAAAHGKGIVHRDLKPENLVVAPDGLVKILDFGIAKKTEPRSEDETSVDTVTGHTEPGAMMGTLSYMSPEQVRGHPVDARSDLFSLGAVLFELLSGQRAFRKDSPAETIAAILLQEPTKPTEAWRSVPPVLVAIVDRCLQKDPEKRFASARELVVALEGVAGGTQTSGPQPRLPVAAGRKSVVAVVIGVALLLVVAGGASFLRRPPATPDEGTGPKRIAVLPFENVGEAGDDYLAEGIADEVRGKLTNVAGLEVIARGSSTPYRKTAKSQRAIARELGVRYLLTATVRWEKGAGRSRVLVSPELVEVSGDGAPASRWQQPFEAELTGVFEVQSEIATRVVQALGVALAAGAERRLLERPTRSVDAYDAFLRGEAASSSLGVTDPASLRRAIALYEEAVALDPSFAQAWARLAMASTHLYVNSVPTPALLERVRAAAERAMALAPDRPEAYLAQSSYVSLAFDDHHLELELLEKARRLSPASPEVLTSAALVEQSLGRWDATVAHLRQAERLDPRSVLTKRRLALAFLLLGRTREAREVVALGRAIAPSNLVLIELQVMTHLVEGDLARAKEVVRSAPPEVGRERLIAHLVGYQDLVWLLDGEERALLLSLPPAAFDDDRGLWGLRLAHAYARAGERAKARVHALEAKKAFEEQLRGAPGDVERVAALGVALAMLGRKAEAIREGERAVALVPVAKDAYHGPLLLHKLVGIYLLVGEPEKALDRLERLLSIPYTLSPGWLRLDPAFDGLRGNPRFQRLLSAGSPGSPPG